MDAVIQRDETALSEMPAVQRRIREDNIVPFRDKKSGKIVTPEQQATDPRRGYTLGLMLLDGTITEEQHEAGIRYAEDMARYYGLTGVPFPSPRAQNLFAVRGEAAESESKAERARKARDRMKELQAVLQRVGDINTGRRVSHSVQEVAFLDNIGARRWPEHMLLYLRRGLNAVHSFYTGAG
jgi:hypothetical protein